MGTPCMGLQGPGFQIAGAHFFNDGDAPILEHLQTVLERDMLHGQLDVQLKIKTRRVAMVGPWRMIAEPCRWCHVDMPENVWAEATFA